MKRRACIMILCSFWIQAAAQAIEPVQTPRFSDWKDRETAEAEEGGAPAAVGPDRQGAQVVEEKKGGREYKKLVYTEEAYLKLKDELAQAHQDYMDLEVRRQTEAEQSMVDKADLFRELGVAYSEAGRYPDAIRMLEQSLRLVKDRPETYYYLGLLYRYQQREPKKAEDALKRYLELRPKAENRKAVENLIEAIRSERTA